MSRRYALRDDQWKSIEHLLPWTNWLRRRYSEGLLISTES
jgi:hypothetical protein